MSATVKKINGYFKAAVKSDIELLKNNILLSERQERIFDMFYLKKQDICFIADSLYISPSVVKVELRLIRGKIERVI